MHDVPQSLAVIGCNSIALWILMLAEHARDNYAAAQGTKMCRYSWHSAGSSGWPFPMLKYKYILEIKYKEAILSNSTRKLLRFEIRKMTIAV